MDQRATGEFETSTEHEPPFDDQPGALLARSVVTKKFQGDLAGSGVVHMTAALSSAENTSAGYVALERVQGTLHGRSGSFVLQHNALSDRGERSLNIVVVPDTGTDELAGIRGSFDIVMDGDQHTYVFEYTLP